MDDPDLTVDDLDLLGISDGAITGAELLEAVRAVLEVTGVSARDLAGTTNLAQAMTDFSLRTRRGSVAPGDVPALVGLSPQVAARLSLALGFPLVGGRSTITEAELEMLQFFAGLIDAVGTSPALQLARVLGTASHRLAQAVVSLFRQRFELPLIETGATRADIIRAYAGIAEEAFPRLLDVIGTLVRGHLVEVAGTDWIPEASGSAMATVQDVTVGFADLEHFTTLAEGAQPDELLATVVTFEAMTTNAIVWHGGTVVKLIGDEVMFVAPTVDQGAQICDTLHDLAALTPELPRLRIGLHCGELVSSSGDYYGAVVNTAARLVDEAAPGQTVVTAAVVGRLGADRVLPLGERFLRGMARPVEVFELVRTG